MTTEDATDPTATDTTDTEAGTNGRAARGSSTPQTRLARAQATLRGLAADVLAHPDAAVTDAYRATLNDLQKLITAYGSGAE